MASGVTPSSGPAGLLALAFPSGAELLVVFFVRGQSVREYLDSRDPLTGSLYALSLVAFALMPRLAGGRNEGDET